MSMDYRNVHNLTQIVSSMFNSDENKCELGFLILYLRQMSKFYLKHSL
jgi:hypothetical protein